MYQRKDAYYTRAKQSGYRSRAAYKLEELARQYRLLRPGDRVVDLGAWPGGWVQVAAKQVGSHGKVVGVDLQRIEPFQDLPQVTLLQADLADDGLPQRLHEILEGPAQLVLSDAAPKLSGVRDRDVAVADALAHAVLNVTLNTLAAGGCLVIKLFMSETLPPFLSELRGHFQQVRSTRPDATRKGSAELYAIATGFRPLNR